MTRIRRRRVVATGNSPVTIRDETTLTLRTDHTIERYWSQFSVVYLFNPWHEVRFNDSMVLVYERMPDSDLLGCTDGVGTIWLDTRLSYVQARCTLAHELVHIDYGHRGHQDETVEASVRLEAARGLVDWGDMILAFMWGTSMDQVACELAVTEHVLMDRLKGLRPAVRWSLISSAASEIERLIA